MIIKCNFEGCDETVIAVGPHTNNVSFTCRKHTPAAEKDINFQDYQFDKKLNTRSPGIAAFNEFGGNRGSGGFQIITVEQRAAKDTPDWAKSDEKIAELIRRVFPKFETDQKQRFRAGRWSRVIYLHFKLNYTLSQIADEMVLPEMTVKNILNRARRVAAGRTSSNSAKRKS